MSIKKSIHILSTTGLRSLLCLLFIAGSLSACAAAKTKKKKSTQVHQTMTVARIIPATPTDSFTEVTFSESQRFYRVSNKTGRKYLKILKAAEKKGKHVLITRASEQSDIILKVQIVNKPMYR